MIGDHFGDKRDEKYKLPPSEPTIFPYIPGPSPVYPEVTKIEFDKMRDELKKEIKDLQELLKKAKIYDEQNNEPDCELEDKKKRLREIAEAWGLEIEFP